MSRPQRNQTRLRLFEIIAAIGLEGQGQILVQRATRASLSAQNDRLIRERGEGRLFNHDAPASGRSRRRGRGPDRDRDCGGWKEIRCRPHHSPDHRCGDDDRRGRGKSGPPRRSPARADAGCRKVGADATQERNLVPAARADEEMSGMKIAGRGGHDLVRFQMERLEALHKHRPLAGRFAALRAGGDVPCDPRCLTRAQGTGQPEGQELACVGGTGHSVSLSRVCNGRAPGFEVTDLY